MTVTNCLTLYHNKGSSCCEWLIISDTVHFASGELPLINVWKGSGPKSTNNPSNETKPNWMDTTRTTQNMWLMSELLDANDRTTILVYDIDWGCHWGVAINTCVIPLLPQSVNRAGGGESEAVQVCKPHSTETSPSWNLPSMSVSQRASCFSLLQWTPSFEWHLRQGLATSPWLLNLANMFYKHASATLSAWNVGPV